LWAARVSISNASRLVLHWIQPEEKWRAIWSRTENPWSKLPNSGVAVKSTGLTPLAFRGNFQFRPDIGPMDEDATMQVMLALG
jgi:hypothetical protein